jgi:hypothetical protein
MYFFIKNKSSYTYQRSGVNKITQIWLFSKNHPFQVDLLKQSGVKSEELRTKSGGTATIRAYCLNCDFCDLCDFYDADYRRFDVETLDKYRRNQAN